MGEWTLQEFQGLLASALSPPVLCPAVPPSPGTPAGLSTGRKSPGCSQTGVSPPPPGCTCGPSRGCSFPRPKPIQRLPATLPAPGFTHPAALPGRKGGLPASRALVAPHALPASGREEEGSRHSPPPPELRAGRRPPRQDAPSARPGGLAARALLGDRRPASPGPRRTTHPSSGRRLSMAGVVPEPTALLRRAPARP